jgi:hypothetical protein
LRRTWDHVLYGLKGDAYRAVFFQGSRHLPHPVVGGGPGNYTSNIARLTHRPLAYLPHMAYRLYAVDRRSVSLGGSILTIPMTGFISLWGELGPVGFALFWGCYVYAGLRVHRKLKADLYTSTIQATLAEAFVPTVFAFIGLNSLIDGVNLAHINQPIWIWAALVWVPLSVDVGGADDEADARHPGPAGDGGQLAPGGRQALPAGSSPSPEFRG